MRTTVTIETSQDDGTAVVAHSIDVGEVAQKHVLRHFNMTNDAKVDMTKVLCAALIQQMLDLSNAPNQVPHVWRAAWDAIRLIEATQMQAVKANFVQA